MSTTAATSLIGDSPPPARGVQRPDGLQNSLDAASRLIDPAGVVYLSEDRHGGTAYDVVNARVWERLCALPDHDLITVEQVTEIIGDEYGDHFGTPLTLDDGELRITHQGSASDAPPAADEMALLVYRRLSTAVDVAPPAQSPTGSA